MTFCLNLDPPTQMQKDIWYVDGRDTGGEAEVTKRMKMLRWLCWECDTVQLP